MLPELSIVIPNYNYGRYLGELIQSIIGLDPLPGTVVFVDDASTDNSREEWEASKGLLEERGVRTLSTFRERNGGTAAAINSGVELTSSEWVWPIASDDKFNSQATKIFLRLKDKADVIQAAQQGFGVDSKGVPLKGNPVRRYRRHQDLVKAFRRGKRLSSGCSPFKRYYWQLAGGLDESLRTSEDTAFWLTLSRLGATFLPTTKPCVWVRYHVRRKSFSGIVSRSERIALVRKSAFRTFPKIYGYATEKHFVDHLAPVLLSLPPILRGSVIVPKACLKHAEALGLNVSISNSAKTTKNLVRGRWVLIANGRNASLVEEGGGRAVLMEHGAGQTYYGEKIAPVNFAKELIEELNERKMKVDFFATETHFRDHLLPVYLSLEEELRGTFFLPANLRSAALAKGVNTKKITLSRIGAINTLRKSPGHLTVTAASGNQQVAAQAGRETILMEHGAGQSYTGTKAHSSYAGFKRRRNISGFIMPGPHGEKLNKEAYPHLPIVSVGSPKLDPYHRGDVPYDFSEKRVVISFHWDCKVVQETRSAFPFYKDELVRLKKELEKEGYTLYGHAHPRFKKTAFAFYKSHGIPVVEDFSEVLKTALLYVCDNSSTIFEFASLDRPVVLLNCSYYRKKIEHGLRFWDAAGVGVEVEDKEELIEKVLYALSDPEEVKRSRKENILKVYTYIDGKASERAAAFIAELAQRASLAVVPTVKRVIRTKQARGGKREMATYAYLRANRSFSNKRFVEGVYSDGSYTPNKRGLVNRGSYFRVEINKQSEMWMKGLISDGLASTVTSAPGLPRAKKEKAPAASKKVEEPSTSKPTTSPEAKEPEGEEPEEEKVEEEDEALSTDLITIEKHSHGGHFWFSDDEYRRGKENALKYLTTVAGYEKEEAEEMIDSAMG